MKRQLGTILSATTALACILSAASVPATATASDNPKIWQHTVTMQVGETKLISAQASNQAVDIDPETTCFNVKPPSSKLLRLKTGWNQQHGELYTLTLYVTALEPGHCTIVFRSFNRERWINAHQATVDVIVKT